MQPLRYERPTSVDEVVRLLQEGGPGARPLAGGTDLIVQAREGARAVDLIVDIKHLPETQLLSFDPGEGLTVGACVPLYRVYEHPEIRRHYPCLVDAASVVGGKAVQGRATLGGNLCNSSPAADTIPAMMVLEGVAQIVGPDGARSQPVDGFCTAPGRNVLLPGEFVASISFPPPAPGSGAAWQRFIPRNEMDIAVASSAVHLRFEGDRVSWARVAIGAVAATPRLVQAAAEALIGGRLANEDVDRAAHAARDAALPIDDMRGSVRQRKALAAVLTTRMIRLAQRRAQGSAE